MIKKRIKSGDAEIYCEIYGEANMHTLVLLHGNGEELHYFDKQIEHFSQSFKVIAIDSRGHGKSTRGTEPLNFSTLANDVLHVLDVLNSSKAHILGFSDGAITALHIALTKPERLYSMILLGANYTSSGILLEYRLAIQLNYFWLFVLSLFSIKWKKKKEIWALMVFYPKLTLKEISTIKIPTLIVTGENDMVSQKQNNEMHNAIIGSERIIIPKANHFLSAKKPEDFNKIADLFLQRILINQ